MLSVMSAFNTALHFMAAAGIGTPATAVLIIRMIKRIECGLFCQAHLQRCADNGRISLAVRDINRCRVIRTA